MPGPAWSPARPLPAPLTPWHNRTNVDVSFDADPATGIATYDAQTFGDIDNSGTPSSGWLPGGAGGTSIASAEWAGLVALANQVRVANGKGFLGPQLNADIYHVAETYGQEDFNVVPPTTTAATGNTSASFDGTGWGTPRATNLITRLGISDVTTVNGGITWTGAYQLAITQTGPLQGPGAGFFVGNGTVAGGPDGFNLTFTPATTQPINFTLVAGQDDETDTAPYASITSLVVNTLKRNDATGAVYGTGTASLLVQVSVPVFVPPPSGGGGGPPLPAAAPIQAATAAAAGTEWPTRQPPLPAIPLPLLPAAAIPQPQPQHPPRPGPQLPRQLPRHRRPGPAAARAATPSPPAPRLN